MPHDFALLCLRLDRNNTCRKIQRKWPLTKPRLRNVWSSVGARMTQRVSCSAPRSRHLLGVPKRRPPGRAAVHAPRPDGRGGERRQRPDRAPLRSTQWPSGTARVPPGERDGRRRENQHQPPGSPGAGSLGGAGQGMAPAEARRHCISQPPTATSPASNSC